MRYILLLAFLVGCQDWNSNSFDRTSYGSVGCTDPDPNFCAAFTVTKNRCATCHYHQNWSTYTTNEKWINESGVINKNDPANSQFIIRIINTNTASSNMPEGGSALPDAEYDLLNKWIDEMP